MIEMIFLGALFYGGYKCCLVWIETQKKKQLEADRKEGEERELRLLEARRYSQPSSRKRHRTRKRRKALARMADWENDEDSNDLDSDFPDSPPLETRPVVRLSLPAPEAVAEPIPAASIETQGWNKWLVLGLCILYIIFPIDIIPDFIPVLGWGDDAMAMFIGIQKFMTGTTMATLLTSSHARSDARPGAAAQIVRQGGNRAACRQHQGAGVSYPIARNA